MTFMTHFQSSEFIINLNDMLMVGGCFNIYTNLLAAPDSRHNPFVCPLAASGCSLHAAAEWILGIIYYRGSSPP